MTNPTKTPWNGLPPDPQKDGWHWLEIREPKIAYPWWWNATEETWRCDDVCDEDSAAYDLAKDWTYLRPCPTPAELDAMEKERQGLVKRAAELEKPSDVEKIARAWDPVGWHWYDNATDEKLDHVKFVFFTDQMTRAGRVAALSEGEG